ncbi:hypothetical protein BGZ65_005307, partial [Modicella reniformis]
MSRRKAVEKIHARGTRHEIRRSSSIVKGAAERIFPSTTEFVHVRIHKDMSAILLRINTAWGHLDALVISPHHLIHKRMGILEAFCLVSNGSSIFGVTVTSNNTEGADPTQQVVVLFKTNDNPDSLANFRWNIVSTVQIGAVYDISQRTNPLCSIDAKGVFTYVDLSVIKSPGAPSMTAGIRYSPDFPPNTGGTSTSPGGWKNIDTAGPYPWEKTSLSATVFNVPDASGNLVSVYAWMVGYVGNLQFGYLDNASLQLRTGSTWTLPTSISIIDISYFNQTLYLLFKELVQLDDKYGLLTIPFNSSVIPAAAPTNYTGLGYQMDWPGKPFPIVVGSWADNYYAIRRYNDGRNVNDVLTVINFANVKDAKFRDDVNLTEPVDVFFETTSHTLWATVGGSNGLPTFGFYNRFDHSDSAHISVVHLDGPNVGKWEYASWEVNVTEPYGVHLYPPPPMTGSPESSSSPSASTGLIVGCVVVG